MTRPEDERAPGKHRSRLRRITIDLTPLRASRDYRLLLSGSFTSELGYQFARIAIYVQITELTGSAAAVGLFGLISLVALFIGTVVGGSFIDAHDRRTTLAWAQVAHIASAAILLGGAIAGHPPIGLIYGAGALHALVGSIDQPTRSAMVPRLVGDHMLPSAAALSQVMWQTTGIVGPALAGIVIARAGYGWAYGIDLVTYGALFAAALLMRPMPPEHDPEAASGWDAVKEGFRYVRESRLISSTFVIDLIAMIFGLPVALFTFLAFTQFHRGPEIVGILFAAPAVGALAAALMAGWTKSVRRQGLAVIWAVAAWGCAIAAFGSVGSNLPLALVLPGARGSRRRHLRDLPLHDHARDHAGSPARQDVSDLHPGSHGRPTPGRLRGGARGHLVHADDLGGDWWSRVHPRLGRRRDRLPGAPAVSRGPRRLRYGSAHAEAHPRRAARDLTWPIRSAWWSSACSTVRTCTSPVPRSS